MAQCLICKTTIADHKQYCEDCSIKKSNADESYLDQLLSLVAPSDHEVSRKSFKHKDKDKDRQEHQEDIAKIEEEEVDFPAEDEKTDRTDEDFPAEDEKTDRTVKDLLAEEEKREIERTAQDDVEKIDEIAEEIANKENIKDDLFGELPKDYNIFSKTEDDSFMDFLNEIFENTEEEELVAPTQENLREETLVVASQRESSEEEDKESDVTSDTGNFSDSDQDILELISQINNTEEDHTIDEDILSMITSVEGSSDFISEIEPVTESEIIQNKVKIEKKAKKEMKAKKEKKKKRHGFTLFRNIKEERTIEEIETLKQKVIKEGEEKEKERKAKKEAAFEQKKQKKEKEAEQAKIKQEEARKQKAEKLQKAKEKREAKAQHSREIQELIDEIDANEGRINKVGATIIFAFFATIAVFIVVGTKVFSYSLSIQNAKNNFAYQHYNEAYYNVYGIDIRDEDIEIYDKIMTVMYVNKQLNSYDNYCDMGKYPQALDSLLKGLKRYDKYYSLATMLGIDADFNFIRNEILNRLNTTFQVSEEEAKELLTYEDQEQYSAFVYKLASKRIELSKEGNFPIK